ncbi:hypothetical protein [Spirochaeta isovalerica]|uniref:Lipoprotein n=1 Tax=Spirochaeta isovalerica TaxID=150 RepID=A0A841R5J7_9SPIO|nr:hypothetical protein [Spirochaeta isovalerica]MBB6480454.1 hypothetical protein [Spirochaeta isovalerica]
MKKIIYLLMPLLLLSCAPSNSGVILFTTESVTNQSRSLASESAARPVSDNNYFVSEIDDYYTALGSKVEIDGKTAFTPTNFVLAMGSPLIGGMIDGEARGIIFGEWWNALENAQAMEEYMHVDFIDDYPYEVEGTAVKGDYDTMNISIFISYSDVHLGSQSRSFDFAAFSYVVIEVPGYTVDDWPDICNLYDADMNPVYYVRENLGGSVFKFEFQYLLPKVNASDDIAEYVFSDRYTEAELIQPGINAQDLINISEYGNLVGENITGRDCLLLPFDKFAVDDYTTLSFSLDPTDIIEIYDKGTPGKDDDVITLVNGYWNRFILEAR